MKFDVAYTVPGNGTRLLRGLSGQQASWVKVGLGSRLISITVRRTNVMPGLCLRNRRGYVVSK
jgi:hypothetical protein